MEIRETHEQIEHAHEENNKHAAILIIVLAAVLAIIEMAGKEAQFAGLALNIQASDHYAFYQAKKIRQTIALTAAEKAAIDTPPDRRSEEWSKQVKDWTDEAARLYSDEKTQGQQELLVTAKAEEQERDLQVARYHMYEYASAILQLAIVLASAAVITEISALELASGLFGLVGLAFALLGAFAPRLIDF